MKRSFARATGPFLLTLLLAAALPLAAQDLASFEKRVTVKTLPNGLTVLILRRDEAPVFSFFTMVDTGSSQDPLSKTGLAHMMEHMAFKGTPDIGTTIREIEQKRPQAPQQKSPSLQVDQPPRPAAQAPPGVTFAVKRLRITGASVFPESKLLPLVKEYEGRDVSLADLEQAAARVSKFYRQNGFPVARAYVPAQEIKDGVVEIAVLEGRYGKLDLRNSSRLSDSLARSTLSAASSGAVIEQSRLERDLLLLKDLAVDRSAFDRIMQAGGFISVRTGGAPDANAITGFQVMEFSRPVLNELPTRRVPSEA
jgi:predicted Zn-dependent peptidase